MPLLNITESKKVTAIVTIEENTARQVDQYAAMTKGTADEVVQQALAYVFLQRQRLRDLLQGSQRREAEDRDAVEEAGCYDTGTVRVEERHQRPSASSTVRHSS